MFYRRLIPLMLSIVLAWTAPAAAAVTITFYSHDFGSSYPHAFIFLEGTPDNGGAAVSGDFGFTARSATPAVLLGSVIGEIQSASPGYVRNSRAHWRMTLSDGQYALVLAVIEKWRSIPGKSYSLNKRNCVHFVADVARTLGMDVVEPKELMKKPRSFLQSVLARNTTLEVTAADGLAEHEVPTLRATALAAADPGMLAPPTPAAAMNEEQRAMSNGAAVAAPSTPPAN